VIVVAGSNKIVDDLEEGLRRARDLCVPQCGKLLGLNLPCVSAGHCVECDTPHSICCAQTIVTRGPQRPEMLVVLIGERLGH